MAMNCAIITQETETIYRRFMVHVGLQMDRQNMSTGTLEWTTVHVYKDREKQLKSNIKSGPCILEGLLHTSQNCWF